MAREDNSNPMLAILTDLQSKVRNKKKWESDGDGVEKPLTTEEELRGADLVIEELRKRFAPDHAAIRKAAFDLYSVTLEGDPFARNKAEDEEEDEGPRDLLYWEYTPFFSEAYLYRLLGKEDARSVLGAVRLLIEATGLPSMEVWEIQGRASKVLDDEENKVRENLARQEKNRARRAERKKLEESGEAIVTTRNGVDRLRVPEAMRAQPDEMYLKGSLTSPIPIVKFIEVDKHVGMLCEEGLDIRASRVLVEALEAKIKRKHMWESNVDARYQVEANAILRDLVTSGKLKRSTKYPDNWNWTPDEQES